MTESQNIEYKSTWRDEYLRWICGFANAHPSRPANRNIAELFFKAGYIEVWGRGIAKILNACKNAGLPDPIMEEYAGGIQITFLKSNNVVENVVEDVVENVAENEKLILKLLIEQSKISATLIAEKTGFSGRTVQRYLKSLQEKKIIKRIGPARGGYWEIVDR